MLPLGLTAEALAAAAAEKEPESPAGLARLRKRFAPPLAAAAVTQVMLRRHAVGKFGPDAADLFFTRDGLEQASRPAVAAHHAARMVAAGVRRVVDLGCGIGTDAMAFARAGLDVVAVDQDPMAAEVARVNLDALDAPGSVRVLTGAAEDLWPALRRDSPGAETGIFCDPARRTARGRSWRVADLSPAWSFVAELLTGGRPAGIKLGPGLPHEVIPVDVEAEWVSSGVDTVEVGLWSGPGARPGVWSALVLADPPRTDATLTDSAWRLVTTSARTPEVDRPRAYLYEPLGAVMRSRGVATLAAELGAALLHPDLGYLTADASIDTRFAQRFAILEAFPYRDRHLRRWAVSHGIGALEIKTRGLSLDPAELRPRLRLQGAGSATVVITRTVDGPRFLVVRREWVPSGAG